MPYIHPDLGVPCMNSIEFWNREGEREGKPGVEVMHDFFAEMAEEDRIASSDLMSDHGEMLNRLKEYYSPEYGDNDWQPVEIVSVEDAEVHTTMRKCSTTFAAVVKCSDGKNRKLHYTEAQYSGSYMDPPDYDCNCVEIVD